MGGATLSKPAAATGVQLTTQEKVLRGVLWFVAIESLAFVVIYVVSGLTGHENFQFVTNSAVKDFLFVMIAGIAAVDVRRFGWLTWLVIIGHVGLILVNALLLVFTHQDPVKI